MNILEQIKNEKNQIVDPVNLFEELAELTGESIRLIASLFARHNNESRDEVCLRFYRYDEVIGLIFLDEHDKENIFIENIARGGERIIITPNISDWCIGEWALSTDGSIYSDINGIIPYTPFYFARDDVIYYLNFHNLPLPPCATQSESVEKEFFPTEDANNLLTQLAKAKEEIEELKKKLFECENEQIKKGSTKTINAQAKFIKALLYVHYGVDVANNPRPHIENIDGEIKLDFDRSGLGRELPSYLTVKQWVDRVELDISS